MAKKSRVPSPPRKVQTPTQRAAPRTPDERRRFYWLIGIAAAGVVGLVVALVVILTTGNGGGTSLAAAMEAAGCTYKTYPSQGNQHVTAVPKGFTYSSFPPTSGPHDAQPVIWGSYRSPVSELQAIHNLEHGGIVIQYGDNVPAATVGELQSFYDSSPNGLLLAPLPRLGDRIALTAWTHLSTCSRFDDGAFTAFRDAFRGKGPERIPLDKLTPGSS